MVRIIYWVTYRRYNCACKQNSHQYMHMHRNLSDAFTPCPSNKHITFFLLSFQSKIGQQLPQSLNQYFIRRNRSSSRNIVTLTACWEEPKGELLQFSSMSSGPACLTLTCLPGHAEEVSWLGASAPVASALFSSRRERLPAWWAFSCGGPAWRQICLVISLPFEATLHTAAFASSQLLPAWRRLCLRSPDQGAWRVIYVGCESLHRNPESRFAHHAFHHWRLYSFFFWFRCLELKQRKIFS